MLGESDRELVANAVDGDLSDDREPLFRRLLAESADARTLFHQLLADRQAIQSLPCLNAPPDTADLVLRQIGRLPRVTPNGPTRGVGRWIGYAVAASVFLAAGGLAYWIADRVPDRTASPNFARKPTPRKRHADPTPPGGTAVAELIPSPRPVADPTFAPNVVARTVPADRPEQAPLPRAAGSDAVVGFSPQPDAAQIREVDVRLPFLTTLDGLDRPENRARLLTELSGEPANRIDLFCTDLVKAGGLFHAAAKKVGLHVDVDAASRELARNRLTVAFAVYTESLTPTESVALLHALAGQVREASGTAVGACHVYPAGAADQRELRELLGVEVGPWPRTKPATGPRSVAAGTGDQLAAQLAKGKSALMLTYLPVTGRTAPGLSKEVRTFLTHRSERKPGTVPLLLVFRTSN